MSTLPALDLSDFAHPLSDREWVYGPRLIGGLGTVHPITVSADPAPGERMLMITGPFGADRDQIPHLIAFLTAVYEATAPTAELVERDDQIVEALRVAYGPGKCACGGHLPVSTHSHGVASCVSGGGR